MNNRTRLIGYFSSFELYDGAMYCEKLNVISVYEYTGTKRSLTINTIDMRLFHE